MANKYKADGLFYVTQKMLYDNYACVRARKALAQYKAKLAGMSRANRDYVVPNPEDTTPILVTAKLIEFVQERAVGGVHHWMLTRVPGYMQATQEWHNTSRTFAPSHEQKVMGALYLLAKRRGLTE